MRGVVYLGESEVEVREFERPEPGPGQVVVEMRAAGLCGSDLHKYHSSREWARERKGMISGHEPAGIVAEAGKGVANVSEGDRVSVYHTVGCGHCAVCLSGTPVFCSDQGAFGRTRDGSHADYMVTDARYCMPLPDNVSFTVGTQLACTAGTAFSAVNKVSKRHGDPLVVFGLGPVGLTTLLMGEAMGYRTLGVDVSPFRTDLADRIGVGVVINADENDPVQAVRDLTGGRGAAGVVECSGSAIARTQAAAVAGLHGTVVYVGAGAPSLEIDFVDILRKELTLRGNSVYSMGAYFDAVAFIQTHRVPLDEIVTHRFRLEHAREAFAIFDRGETGKVVFDWEDEQGP
ncbi:MAG: alcohol dehydrogenase catalytic domain-containing protein [Candidatus Latescibacteria bacterium]|nr:alcohol dehydrogenase catalytic domain-containing protein [Candidatus Latescibacterota bacterium]